MQITKRNVSVCGSPVAFKMGVEAARAATVIITGMNNAASPHSAFTAEGKSIFTMSPFEIGKFLGLSAVNVFPLRSHVSIEGQFMQAEEKTDAKVSLFLFSETSITLARLRIYLSMVFYKLHLAYACHIAGLVSCFHISVP